MKDQNGDPLRVIPIIIGKNCTIHTKSREFLDELDIRMESVYEEIGNLLGVYKANCTAIMYKKKVSQHSTERREQVNFQINQNEILLSLPVIQEEVRMELTMQNNKTQTQILCSQYIAEISLSRVNEHEQEETDQRVMTLFPALNLETLRVVDTLVPRFIPAIPKIVTKITSEVNNVSSSAELTQVV
ncbi:Hypothetical_protein [Hexamita inflata]|uniref:Hypothetical_protein n=1 Tax=Hexamita inflata TaxID=28002 RepID=A0AA86U0Y5_9EUKA|nr:Hypothetical protein HINF_LOCUS23686 [Hexamita inflata]